MTKSHNLKELKKQKKFTLKILNFQNSKKNYLFK